MKQSGAAITWDNWERPLTVPVPGIPPALALLPGAKCTRCKAQAVVRLVSHNSRFCPACFDRFFLSSVSMALRIIPLPKDETIAVAVSGGKDSLTVWDALRRLEYPTLGIHLDLGIDMFSQYSREAAAAFAEERGLELRVIRLKDVFGAGLPGILRKNRKDPCSVCGTVKRHYLNLLCVEAGTATVVTGHNLDDEAGRLLGNLVRHRERYIEKFHPFLPSAMPGQAARAKPLYRVDEGEIRTYAALHNIRPAAVNVCPFAKGATSTYFKEALELLEQRMPGTKRDLVYGRLKGKKPPEGEAFLPCSRCGQPTFAGVCAVCQLKDRVFSTD
jgi:uncharacterized protein (TIGR00269 family)